MGPRFPNNAGILAIDLARHRFQVCTAASTGEVLYNSNRFRHNSGARTLRLAR